MMWIWTRISWLALGLTPLYCDHGINGRWAATIAMLALTGEGQHRSVCESIAGFRSIRCKSRSAAPKPRFLKRLWSDNILCYTNKRVCSTTWGLNKLQFVISSSVQEKVIFHFPYRLYVKRKNESFLSFSLTTNQSETLHLPHEAILGFLSPFWVKGETSTFQHLFTVILVCRKKNL